MKRTANTFMALATTALMAGLTACGGGSSSPAAPTAVATPPPPVSSVVSQGAFSGLAALNGWWSAPFTTSSAGRLEATVDWTFARNDVDLYILRGNGANCTLAQFNARQCDYLAFSESISSKPERVSAPNAPAGTYTLIVVNWGPDSESFSYQAMLTTGGTAASARAQGGPQQKVGLEHVVTGR